jgi:hypothetical protein
MRCHSCAHLDLFTRLCPEGGDDGLDRVGVFGGEPDGYMRAVSVSGLYRCLWRSFGGMCSIGSHLEWRAAESGATDDAA